MDPQLASWLHVCHYVRLSGRSCLRPLPKRRRAKGERLPNTCRTLICRRRNELSSSAVDLTLVHGVLAWQEERSLPTLSAFQCLFSTSLLLPLHLTNASSYCATNASYCATGARQGAAAQAQHGMAQKAAVRVKRNCS